MENRHFNAKAQALDVLCEHNTAILSGIHCEFNSNQDMLDVTTEECAFILTNRLVEGKYTPMQFNAVRNELAELLWNIFGASIEAEQEEKKRVFQEALREAFR